MDADQSIRDELRALPVFAAPSPFLDYSSLPDSPSELFRAWLHSAIASGVPEPHSMTLSTVDDDGAPDARVLILKDQVVDDWLFASSSTSSKGQQLQAAHRAALTFYWPGLGRQVRVRGRVEPRDAQATTHDFLARGMVARSVALASAKA
jgi:pyridoxamine 5'-phosphate oxidase